MYNRDWQWFMDISLMPLLESLVLWLLCALVVSLWESITSRGTPHAEKPRTNHTVQPMLALLTSLKWRTTHLPFHSWHALWVRLETVIFLIGRILTGLMTSMISRRTRNNYWLTTEKLWILLLLRSLARWFIVNRHLKLLITRKMGAGSVKLICTKLLTYFEATWHGAIALDYLCSPPSHYVFRLFVHASSAIL